MPKEKEKIVQAPQKDKAAELFDIIKYDLGFEEKERDRFVAKMRDRELAAEFHGILDKKYNGKFGDFDEFWSVLKKKDSPLLKESPKDRPLGVGFLQETLSDGSQRPKEYSLDKTDEELENRLDFESLVAPVRGGDDPSVPSLSEQSTPISHQQAEFEPTVDDFDKYINALKSERDRIDDGSMTFGSDPRSLAKGDVKLQEQRQNISRAIDFMRQARNYLKADERPENWMMPKVLNDLFRGAAATDVANFATAGLKELVNNIDVLRIVNKRKSGEKLSEEEDAVLKAYGILQNMKNKDRSIAFGVGKGVMDMIPYMAQFIATGGVGDAVFAGTTKLIGKKVLSRVAATGVAAAAQAPLMPAMYTAAVEGMTGELDEEGKAIPGTAQTPGEAFKRAYIDMVWEVGAEAAFSRIVRGGVKYGIKEGLKAGQRMPNKFMSKAKWDGLVEEYAEELVTSYGQALTDSDKKLKDVWDTKEQITTFLTVSVVHGAGSLAKGKKSNMDEGLSDGAIRKKHLFGMSEPLVKEIDEILKSDDINEIADNLTALVENNKINEKDKLNMLSYSAKMLYRKGRETEVEEVVAPEDIPEATPEAIEEPDSKEGATEVLAEETNKTKNIVQRIYNIFDRKKADLFSGAQTLNTLPEIARTVDAHGSNKINSIEGIINILTNGIDWNRGFYTAPLDIDPKNAAGAGAGLGTSGGVAYRDGLFMLISKAGKTLRDGIDAVLINPGAIIRDGVPIEAFDQENIDRANKLRDYLQEQFPDINFVMYNEAGDYLNNNWSKKELENTEEKDEDRIVRLQEQSRELDEAVANAQKEFDLPDTPDVTISNDTEVTLDKIDNNEPVTNEFLTKASEELYDQYNKLEAMKESDTRLYTVDQIESMQEVLVEEIEILENYAKQQAETDEFISETKAREVAERTAAETERANAEAAERESKKPIKSDVSASGLTVSKVKNGKPIKLSKSGAKKVAKNADGIINNGFRAGKTNGQILVDLKKNGIQIGDKSTAPAVDTYLNTLRKQNEGKRLGKPTGRPVKPKAVKPPEPPKKKRKPITEQNPEQAAKLDIDEDGNVTIYHRSDQDLDVVDPTKFGTAKHGKTSRQEIGDLTGAPQSFFYAQEGQTEGFGANTYKIKVKADEVYDIYHDPENFYDEAKRRFHKARGEQTAFNPNAQVAWVMKVASEHGYKVGIMPWATRSIKNSVRVQSAIPLPVEKGRPDKDSGVIDIPPGETPPPQSDRPSGYKKGTQGADSFDTKKDPLTANNVVKETVPQEGYGKATSKHKESGARNVLISQSNKPKKGRNVMVQISAELLQRGIEVDPDFQKYYESIYAKTEGYSKTVDFWEAPLWVAEASQSMPDADFYIVRDIAEAQEFLANAGYDNILFSALDVNLDVIDQLAGATKSNIIVGGYASNIDKLSKHDNVKIFKSQETGMADGLKAAGIQPKTGVDYRHFLGAKYIPRLCMSKGCLHKCKFCTVPKGIKETDAANINQQLENMDGIDYELVYLDDKTFGQAKNYAKINEIAEKIRKRNPKFKGFIVQTTATQVIKMEKENPGFLENSPIEYLEIGVESYNDHILKNYRKPHNKKSIDTAVEVVRKSGKKFIPNIIIGFPEETADTYNNTIQFLKDNADVISHANIYNLAVYEDSELAGEVSISSDEDRIETSANKTFHKDPALHKKKGKEMILALQKMIDSGKPQKQEPAVEEVFEKESPKEIVENRAAQEEKQTTKVADNLRDLADMARNLKIPPPASFQSSIGIDVIWNGSMEVFATTLDATASVVDAIAAAIRFIERSEWFKSKTKVEQEKIIRDLKETIVKHYTPPAAEVKKPSAPSRSTGTTKESQTSTRIKGETIRGMSTANEIAAKVRDEFGPMVYDPKSFEEIVEEANELINDLGGFDAAQKTITTPKEDSNALLAAAIMSIKHYSEVLTSKATTEQMKDDAALKINELEHAIDKLNRAAGRMLAYWGGLYKNLGPEGVVQYVDRMVRSENKRIMDKKMKGAESSIGQRMSTGIKEVEDSSKNIADNVVNSKSVDAALSQAEKGKSRQAAAKKPKGKGISGKEYDLDKLRKDARDSMNTMGAIGNPAQIEALIKLGAAYIDMGISNFADFSKRMIADFGDKIRPYLAEIYKKAGGQDYPGVAKKATQSSKFKEGVKKLIQEHWDRRNISELAESLMADMGLAKGTAMEIQTLVEKEINKQIEEMSQRAIARTIGSSRIPSKQKRTNLIEKMVEKIKLGALDKQIYADLFSDFFGLNTLTEEQREEIKRLAGIVEDTTGYGVLSQKAMRDLSQYITEVMPDKWQERFMRLFIGLNYANMLFGPTTHAINMSSAGTIIATMPIRNMMNVSKWVRAIREAKKEGGFDMKKFTAYNPIGESLAMMMGMARGMRSGARWATDVMKTGPLDPSKYEDKVGGDKMRSSELERDNYRLGKSNSGRPKFRKLLVDYLKAAVGIARYSGRALSAEDKFMTSTAYEMQVASLMRRKAALSGLKGSALLHRVDMELRGQQLDMGEILRQLDEQIETYEEGGNRISKAQKRIRLRELILENSSLNAEEHQESMSIAKDNIFMGDRYGVFARGAAMIGQLANRSIGSKAAIMPFVPFTKVVGNVAEVMLDFSPYGFMRAHGGTFSRLAKRGNVRNAALGKKGSDSYYEQIGRAWFGTIAMAMLGALLIGDDDDSFIEVTGSLSGQPDYGQGIKNVKPKYGLRIGKKFLPLSYLYIPPLAIPLAIIGNINDRLSSGNPPEDLEERMTLAMWALMDSGLMIRDMSFVEGVASLSELVADMASISPEDSDKVKGASAKQLAKHFVKAYGTWALRPLPQNNNLLRQVNRMFDPKSFSQKTVKQIMQYYTGVTSLRSAGIGDPDKAIKNRDVFGEVVKSYVGEEQMPWTHFANLRNKDERWKFLSEYDAIPTKMDQTMTTIPGGRESRKLSPEEYDKIVQVAGGVFNKEITALAKLDKETLDTIDKQRVTVNGKVKTGIQAAVDKAWTKSKNYAREVFRANYVGSPEFDKALDEWAKDMGITL